MNKLIRWIYSDEKYSLEIRDSWQWKPYYESSIYQENDTPEDTLKRAKDNNYIELNRLC
jgi:hypothetical protein